MPVLIHLRLHTSPPSPDTVTHSHPPKFHREDSLPFPQDHPDPYPYPHTSYHARYSPLNLGPLMAFTHSLTHPPSRCPYTKQALVRPRRTYWHSRICTHNKF